jgi:hypothetical protein
MMKRIQIVKKLLIICCVAILLIIPWASVFGIKDPGLLEAVNIFQGSAFLVLVTAMVLQLFYQIRKKPLVQDVAEQESKEADQKDTKQLLFKPATRGSIIIWSIISLFVLFIITQFIPPPKVDLGETIAGIGFIVFFLWGWWTLTVFIFTEDSVQIKSYPFYLLGINIKTVIRYADITSVSPDAKIKDNMYGAPNKYRIVISTDGTTQGYNLWHYDKDIVAKLYLRFQEKLGDKVTLE